MASLQGLHRILLATVSACALCEQACWATGTVIDVRRHTRIATIPPGREIGSHGH
jgi:hypothetical protein